MPTRVVWGCGLRSTSAKCTVLPEGWEHVVHTAVGIRWCWEACSPYQQFPRGKRQQRTCDDQGPAGMPAFLGVVHERLGRRRRLARAAHVELRAGGRVHLLVARDRAESLKERAGPHRFAFDKP